MEKKSNPGLEESNFGYICTNCGMGWNGKYIDTRKDRYCPDCNGELEYRNNINEI
jgi:DNA-directed RNA polymerase subunit RPC12/RpoP